MKPQDYLAITRLMNQKHPLELLCRSCQEILETCMSAKNMYLALVEKSDCLRFPYYVDELEGENSLDLYPMEGLTAFVIQQGEIYWARRDAKIQGDIHSIGAEPSDWIGIPLKDRNNATFGVLAVQTYDPALHYFEEDVGSIEFVAIQLSFAIQLHNNARDAAVIQIAALADEASDTQDLYDLIHGIVMELIPAARKNFIIARIDEREGIFRTVFWRDEKDDYDNLRWPIDSGVSAYICKVSGKSLIFEEGNRQLPEGASFIGTPPAFWLGCPLAIGGKIIGVIIIQSYEKSDRITKEDENILNSIREYIGLAISKTEFYERRLNVRSEL